jgi:transposase
MNAPHYYERLQEKFWRLHALGWTFRQMAEALGVSERTVTAWREELDLPRRPRGRRPRKFGRTVRAPRVEAKTINSEEELP